MTSVQVTGSPTRTCVGCGQRDAQPQMIRLRSVGGEIVAGARDASGRSAYVHARGECVRGLIRSRGLERSLRAPVPRPARARLVETLERRLVEAQVVG